MEEQPTQRQHDYGSIISISNVSRNSFWPSIASCLGLRFTVSVTGGRGSRPGQVQIHVHLAMAWFRFES
jgi:hypothetical protein